jgi:hypothetical protein
MRLLKIKILAGEDPLPWSRQQKTSFGLFSRPLGRRCWMISNRYDVADTPIAMAPLMKLSPAAGLALCAEFTFHSIIKFFLLDFLFNL